MRPIHTSSSYFYLEEGPQPYPRYFNTPNQTAVAAKLAELEHAEAGMVFSSGMAAISTCLMSIVAPGDHVLLLQELYGGTHKFLINEFTKFGIEFDFVDGGVEEFRGKLRDNTKVVYVESPTNPCHRILDLKALAAFAQEAGIVSVIDNTFASPINQNPIDFGIDVVVHSATKYLGGHSDLSCGCVLGKKEFIEKFGSQARLYGGNLNAIDCYLLERSIKTLDVRIQRQNAGAMTIAEFLCEQPAVSRVLYPGLPAHPGHEIAAAQMHGFGGMVSFELAEPNLVTNFLTSLNVITPAMSLGGVESTVTVPALTSHLAMTPEDRENCGVTPGLIRFSVGIEAAADLKADLAQALEHISKVQ